MMASSTGNYECTGSLRKQPNLDDNVLEAQVKRKHQPFDQMMLAAPSRLLPAFMTATKDLRQACLTVLGQRLKRRPEGPRPAALALLYGSMRRLSSDCHRLDNMLRRRLPALLWVHPCPKAC